MRALGSEYLRSCFMIKLNSKWLNYAARSYYSTLKTPFVLISLDKWSWNWLESCYRSKIGKFDIHTVSSVSARELKCLSLALLELENSSLNSSLVLTFHKYVSKTLDLLEKEKPSNYSQSATTPRKLTLGMRQGNQLLTYITDVRDVFPFTNREKNPINSIWDSVLL